MPGYIALLEGQDEPRQLTRSFIVLTKCSLAAIMAEQPINPKTNQPYRPHHLPSPTTLPLRHCSHNEDSSPIDEIDCLLSLLSPNAETKKNKEHYTLATADPSKKSDKSDAQQRKRKRDDEREEEKAMHRARVLRIGARSIPGVPIVYVKRSVMVLEPMSNPSAMVREGVETGKFRLGLDAEPSLGKRRRTTGDSESQKKRGLKKAKGPNPLSVQKAKKENEKDLAFTPKQTKSSIDEDGAPKENDAAEIPERPENDDSGAIKTKRRRRHHKRGPREGNGESGQPEASAAMEADS